MQINYSHALGTHVAVDSSGLVRAIYRPAEHGSLAEFRNLVSSWGSA